MTLKDRIENNLTLAALSLATSSFAVGVATDRWAKEVLGSAGQTLECKADGWQELAKKAEWAPIALCPAFPLKFNISSPGNGVTLAYDTSWARSLKIPFVVSVSRPLPDVGDIGFVVKPKDSSNFFTVFPLISRVHDSNTYRAEYGIDLPVNIVLGNEYEIRAVFIDKKRKFGDRFKDIAQIQNTDPSVVLSDPITVRTDK